MEAKRISQRTVKSIINSNTVLLHIGNFETGKRINLRRAVDECVYTSRLYYNTEIYPEREKMKHILQRLTNTRSTTLTLTKQVSITHWL